MSPKAEIYLCVFARVEWQKMSANPHLRCDKKKKKKTKKKKKQRLSERVGEMSTVSHMWWETQEEIEPVPETRVTAGPSDSTLPLHHSPLCDWWASFCQLMENPLLTSIRLLFVTVSVSDCHRLIVIRDPVHLQLSHVSGFLPGDTGNGPTRHFAFSAF